MPRGVLFSISFDEQVNPYLEEARSGHIEWIRAMELVCSEEALQDYLVWDVPQAAARTYPHACVEDLVMLMNWFSLTFLLGEQFDDAPANRAERIACVARELIVLPFEPDETVPMGRCPITAAWAQVWSWASEGMSEPWRDRFCSSWARCLAAHAAQAQLWAGGEVLALDRYLALRRATVGIHQVDAAERAHGTELPPQVSSHPLMRRLRAAAADAAAWMNDIHMLECAEQQGDGHNLVAVLRHERGYSRKAAIDEALWMTRQQLQVYRQLEAGVPRLYDELWLTTDQRAVVEMGMGAIQAWVRSHHDWALDVGRRGVGRARGCGAAPEVRGPAAGGC
ncbi:terpene cyclase [Kitasatospora sp. NPDC085879]|uniref:terpene synthase family protein n=1 Tax=Kitasatospora sp. NPDC085879 TaxID=3154769 RepID=UPI00343FA04C